MLQRIPVSVLVLFVFGLGALAAACAPPPPRVEPPPIETTLTLADFETFDVRPYREVPRPEAVEIEHDVPEELMRGTITRVPEERVETGPRAGFRIQIVLSESRDQAERYRQRAVSWWNSYRTDDEFANLFPRELPIYIVYHQPYFKVRVGDFVSRSEAERAVAALRPNFPDAWIVPDMVTRR